MRTPVLMGLLVVAVAGAGCRREAPRTSKQILNFPSSRLEGIGLMESVDDEGRSAGWSAGVTREVRRRMTGRLLVAGLNEEEIDRWVMSPLSRGSQTENREEGQ